MNNWNVTVAQLGTWAGIPGPELFWMSDFGKKYTIGLMTVVASNEAGEVAVINTGPTAPDLDRMNAAWARGVGADCQLRVERTIQSVLAELGHSVDDVRWVFATPFQAYTVGNLNAFPHAKICLSRRGWQFFFEHPYSNHPHDYPPNVFPPEVLNYLIYEAAERVMLLDDEHVIAPGMGAKFTGAHHRASVGVWFDTPGGLVVASDSAFVRENLEPGRMLGIIENMYEALHAYEWFRSADHFLPLYDRSLLDRYPNGKIA